MSYRRRLLLSICLLVAGTGTALMLISYRHARMGATTLAESVFQKINEHAMTRTRAHLQGAVLVASSLHSLMGQGLATEDSPQLARQLAGVLMANPAVSGIGYSDEQGRHTAAFWDADGKLHVRQGRLVDGAPHQVEHLVQPDGSWQLPNPTGNALTPSPSTRPASRPTVSGTAATTSTAGAAAGDPRQRASYRAAREAGRPLWLPPGLLDEQQVAGITYADPILDRNGAPLGVLTVDYDLTGLSAFVADLSASSGSQLMLFTFDGMLLAHPAFSGEAQNGRPRDLPRIAEADDPLARTLYRIFRAGAPVSIEEGAWFQPFGFRHGGRSYLASATTFRVGGGLTWVVGVVAPRADFSADVWQSNYELLAASGAAMMIGVLLAMMMARRVSEPILELSALMDRIGRGDLEARADIRGSREFHRLSMALNRMVDNLRDRLRLREAVALATQVQQKLLPANAPLVPGLELAGRSTYSDEAGGDYYDFLPGECGVTVAVGDVMGHGLAASLLMATARGALRAGLAGGASLAQAMSGVNRVLADSADQHFMTLVLLSLEPQQRRLRWCCAGHDAILLFDPASGEFAELLDGQTALGIDSTVQYNESVRENLAAGTVLVIGTDGLWDAGNTGGEAYGKERLRQVIRSAATGSAEQLASAIAHSVADHLAGRAIEDDVTVVVVKLPGKAEKT